MGRIAENLHRMSRVEWNNLAKNNYCDDEIQEWIAKHGHLQARYYLAENPNLSRKAKQTILAGKSVLAKALMIPTGVVTNGDRIREIYNDCKNKFDSWRIQNIFLRDVWRRGEITPSSTPGDILESIYDDFCANRPEGYWRTTYIPRSLAGHANCTLKLAIQISQAEHPETANFGKAALVRVTKKLKEEKNRIV